MNTNAFLELAIIQQETKTMYCGGLDPHPFTGGWHGNYEIYHETLNKEEEDHLINEVYPLYYQLIKAVTSIKEPNNFALILASVECYVVKVIDIMVKKCNIRVFKPQAGFYEQFGPLGMIMLSRIRQHIKDLEKTHDKIICILDAKRGDIATTQTAYFLGLMGNLLHDWGIDYTPFDFDVVNVTPWMGSDVLALGDEKNLGIGLQLMKQGKGIIVVNKTSNPTGPQYQEQALTDTEITLQMLNVEDLAIISKKYDLEASGLSNIGLVVGSTHICDGSIRKAFPTTTLLVPGFGAQGGKFENIIQELIPAGEWAGQGAIFSSSRGTLYPWETKFGGSGNPKNLEIDLMRSIINFRIAETKAFEEPGLKEKGIIYPF